MFHSLPAALIAGELAFLLASGDDVRLRIYKAGAVVLGYVSHLVLDELYSLEWYRGRLRLKRSFGFQQVIRYLTIIIRAMRPTSGFKESLPILPQTERQII